MKLLARPALFILFIVSPCAVPLLASEVEPTLKVNIDLPQGAYWHEGVEDANLAALTLANRSGEAHQAILWVGDGAR